MRSTLAGDDTVGTKIRAGTPSSRAAYATATPWLPPDAAATPAGGTARSSRFVNAPRALNEPAHCSCSSLRVTGPARSSCTVGVLRTCGRIASRARQMSSRVNLRYCVSPVTGEFLLGPGDAFLHALVEDPLPDLRAPHQARLGQQLQVLAARRRAYPQLLGDKLRAHAVLHQVTVALRGKVGHRVTQPLQDPQALLAAQGLDEVDVKHQGIMANS